MEASLKPFAKCGSFYPPPKRDSLRCSKVQLPSGPPPAAKTGRVWRSKKELAAPVSIERSTVHQSIDVPVDEKTQMPGLLENSYGRDQLLLVKQCMMDAHGFGTPAPGSLRCLAMQVSDSSPNYKHSKRDPAKAFNAKRHAADQHDAVSCLTEGSLSIQGNLRANAPEFVPQVDDGSSNFKLLKRPSSESICSTTDTQSDTTDEHDADSSSFESPFMEEPVRATGTLRATAQEFVPHATLRASAPEFVPHDLLPAKLGAGNCIVSAPLACPDTRGQILSSTPLDGAGFSSFSEGPWTDLMVCGCHGAAQ